MSTAEFNSTRNELLQWIGSSSDERLIELLNSIRLSFKAKNEDWWVDLSAVDREGIERGLKDMKAGNTHTSQEFWRKLKNGE